MKASIEALKAATVFIPNPAAAATAAAAATLLGAILDDYDAWVAAEAHRQKIAARDAEETAWKAEQAAKP